MSTRTLLLLLTVLAVTTGCSGRNNPQNPDNEQWFCQSNELGDGWECVQDANLAQVPVPTRMPPEPEPEPSVNLDDPLDLDALTAPLQRNPELPAEPIVVPQAVQDATPALSTEMPPAPAEQSMSQIPKHIALAYVPPEPTAILQLPADFFALQMLAMNTPEQIEQYINDNALKGMSGARVEKDGQVYYVLIVGIYETYSRAEEASEALPPPLDDVEIRIRQLDSLQQAMTRADDLDRGARW
jgi:septal ring-binding cell division protein DamX